MRGSTAGNDAAALGFLALLFLTCAGVGALIGSWDVTGMAATFGLASAYAAWAAGRGRR